jgi:hypothetical protein
MLIVKIGKIFSDDFGILWGIVRVNYPEVGDVSPETSRR